MISDPLNCVKSLFEKKKKKPEQNPSSVFYSTTTWLNL